jgi:hypothetical protein
MFHARKDTGPLVKALVESTPGKNLMGYGNLISFDEIAQIWSQNLGQPVRFQRNTVKVLDELMPGGLGREIGEMMEYINVPGYFGGEEAIKELGLIEPKEVIKSPAIAYERANHESSLVAYPSLT